MEALHMHSANIAARDKGSKVGMEVFADVASLRCTGYQEEQPGACS